MKTKLFFAFSMRLELAICHMHYSAFIGELCGAEAKKWSEIEMINFKVLYFSLVNMK